MSDQHTALIVEDDLLIAGILKQLVTSMGHAFRHAVTLDDVRREVAAGGFCYVLLDMQIPADATSDPHVGCGETALTLLRRSEPRRTAKGRHILPILVVTAYSREPEYVAKVLGELDADDFIAKPFGQRMDPVLDKIRGRLERADRTDHEACLSVASASPSGACLAGQPPIVPRPTPTRVPRGPVVRLSIDGRRGGRRTAVVVEGETRDMQDSLLPVLVSLIPVHKASPGTWSSATKVAMARRRYAPSRIRRTFDGLVPEGFELVQVTAGGEVRLNPNVVVEHVEWEALVDHPETDVQKVAREQVRRGR